MSLTRPCNLNSMGRTLRLDWRKANQADDNGLVKMSASWYLLEMNWIRRIFLATISRTKWKSISTCLVRAWKTGLELKYVAPILSHHSVGDWVCYSSSSEQRDRIQESSAALLARGLYSASVLDLTTVCCFLQLHEMRFLPREIQ